MPVGKKENLILSVETATRGGSLAVLKNFEVCAVWQGDENFSQSGGLLGEIKNILRQNDIGLNNLDLLVGTVGPGSFTDLRIGLSIIKGLAAVAAIPIVGIPTLVATAEVKDFESKSVVALLPAGRDEVFAQIFTSQFKQQLTELKCGKLDQILFEFIAEKELSLIAPLNLHSKINEFMKNQRRDNWFLSQPPTTLAASAGKIAFEWFQKNNFKGNSWQMIYGREAVVLKDKKL